jgi:hypothetical protein
MIEMGQIARENSSQDTIFKMFRAKQTRCGRTPVCKLKALISILNTTKEKKNDKIYIVCILPQNLLTYNSFTRGIHCDIYVWVYKTS